MYGGDPFLARVWQLDCHRCLHHGPPELLPDRIACECCGETFAERMPEVLPPDWQWPRPQATRQQVPSREWYLSQRQTYEIPDLAALKAAYLAARAKELGRMAALMREYVEARAKA
jgi:hypothetical protein